MEKIVFGNAVRSSAKDVDAKEIRGIESDLGEPLPLDFVSFYEKANGGYFIRNCWKTLDDVVYVVGQILPIKYSLSSSGMLLEDSYRTLSERRLLPEGCIPFAVDIGGNYFCVQTTESRVYWLDHEKPLSDKDSVVIISNNFKNFISGLLSEEDVEDFL